MNNLVTQDADLSPNTEWLGSIPEDWDVVPLKALGVGHGALFIDGDWIESKDLSDDGIRYITTGNVGEGVYKEQGSGFITEQTFQKLKCTLVQPGNVLISRLNLPIARACIAPDLGCQVVTSVDNVILRPKKGYDCRFLVYLMSSAAHFFNTENLARGATMKRISRSALGNIRFAVPNAAEQAALSSFLDRETARIDALIEKKTRFIELLKEKRQALITQAVTKGLDPNVPMRDSGVEWIGDVPEHWEVYSMRWHARMASGDFITSESIESEGAFPVFGGNGLRGYTNHFTHDGEYALIGRQGALCGNVNYASGKFWASEHAVVVYPIETHNTYWFGELIRAMNLNQYSISSAQPGLAVDRIRSLSVPVPPKEEQDTIAEHIHVGTAKIDQLTLTTQRSIDLLSERRSALITAAVTGQIDLREAA